MAERRPLVRTAVFVGGLGIVGLLTYLPVIPKLVPPGVRLPWSPLVTMAVAGLQTGFYIAVFSVVGALAARQVGLRSPVAEAWVEGTPVGGALRAQLLPGLICGALGAVAATLLSRTFIAYLTSIPTLARVFYGGFTEEVAARWFLMSGLAWLLWRVTDGKREPARPWVMLLAIAASQTLFATAHWPIISRLTGDHPLGAVATVFVVSLPWGWLFWKFGFEAAVLAHMSFHLFVSLLQVSAGLFR